MTDDLTAIVSQYGLAVVFGNVLLDQIDVPLCSLFSSPTAVRLHSEYQRGMI